MARARSPDRDKAFEIWRDSDGDKKLTEIAQELGVSGALIRKWKSQDNWDAKIGNVTNGKGNVTINKRVRKQREKKIMQKVVAAVEENEALTEKQRLFCIYYVDNHNATQSYLKAYGGNYAAAMTNGCRLRGNDKIKAEIKQLKALMRAELDIDVVDMLNYCLRVVGANIGDYVTFAGQEVDFANSNKVDTSVIAEVKQGKSGVSIKLADKKWAWEQLSKYFDWLPDKHKRQIDKDRLQLLRDKNSGPELPPDPLILQAVYGRPDDEDQ